MHNSLNLFIFSTPFIQGHGESRALGAMQEISPGWDVIPAH